jgi:excisionase family DNA binding protein
MSPHRLTLFTTRHILSTVKDHDLLTVDELAGLLNVKRETVYAWRKQRRGPPAVKMYGTLRFRRRDVDRWLAAHAEQSPRSIP